MSYSQHNRCQRCSLKPLQNLPTLSTLKPVARHEADDCHRASDLRGAKSHLTLLLAATLNRRPSAQRSTCVKQVCLRMQSLDENTCSTRITFLMCACSENSSCLSSEPYPCFAQVPTAQKHPCLHVVGRVLLWSWQAANRCCEQVQFSQNATLCQCRMQRNAVACIRHLLRITTSSVAHAIVSCFVHSRSSPCVMTRRRPPRSSVPDHWNPAEPWPATQ